MIAYIAFSALLLTACSVSFVGRRKNTLLAPTPSTAPTLEQPTASATQTQTQTQGEEMKGNLMAWADDRASAEKIADLYGIKLVLYTNNIAMFYTNETPDTLIRTGKENGWPELSKINPVTKDESKP